MEKKAPPLKIELGEKESEGIYSNLALITHSPSEVIIDFARVVPGSPKAKVYARIIMTPQHAKFLHNALKENLKKYEDRFGKIPNAEPPVSREIGFSPSG